MLTGERPRLVVLGLDGLPLSLARRLCAAHPRRFQHLARLTAQAVGIRAELPELSPVNWTSFYTAAGPEAHGVYGFTRLDPETYALSIADSTWPRCPSIFHRLGERGLVSKVVNLPNTYPARPLKGMLVAGFVAPELSRAVFPPFLQGPLRAAGYRLEADTERGRRDPNLLLAELHATLQGRHKALELLWPDLAWDLFVFVLTETDRLFHFHYPALEDEQDPLHRPCLELLRQWDRCIGELLERFDALPQPKRLLVLADHGFTTLISEVDLNAWLASQGFLRLRGGVTRSELDMRAVLPETRAFALDPGRVYLHDQRFARGQVPPRERDSLLRELRQGLMELRHQGEPVLHAVHLGAELYPGAPQDAHLPDLVCEARPGYDLKAKTDRAEVFGFFGRRGTHTAQDAFFQDSAGAAPCRVRDVGRLVLEHYGLETPAPLGAPCILTT